jgi:transposase
MAIGWGFGGHAGATGASWRAPSAATRNAAFYQRLVTVNKRPGKVALIAVLRKMLVTLNAIARDHEPCTLGGQQRLDQANQALSLADDAPVELWATALGCPKIHRLTAYTKTREMAGSSPAITRWPAGWGPMK